MLWFNVTVGLNSIFFCFKLIIILPYPKTKENKLSTKDEIEPQHIYCFVYQNGHLIVWLKTSKTPRDTTFNHKVLCFPQMDPDLPPKSGIEAAAKG